MAIAILGGTFDPIHCGHLIIGEQAFNNFNLEKIIFMPAGIPPHKENQKITDSQHRLEMVKLATKDNPHFAVSDWELKQEKKSYTADTLKQIETWYPDKKIYLIIGADSLYDIHKWKEPEYILNHANLIVAQRPGFSLENVYKDDRFRRYDDIYIMDSLLLDISSTNIRDMINTGKSVRYLVLPEVFKYIKDHNLYRGD